MKKIIITTHINAPREKVWDKMLGEESYREWTKAFHEGSYYKGSFEEGSKILFLGPGGDGLADGGMVSRIKKSKKPEYVVIEHLGVVVDGKEDTESEEYKEWAGAIESYTFTEKDGGTELLVESDALESMADEMEAMWNPALEKLKEICEK